MKLSALIAHVGDQNIGVQFLHEAFVRATYKGKFDVTDITFRTKEAFGTSHDKVAVVLWIPRDKMPPQS